MYSMVIGSAIFTILFAMGFEVLIRKKQFANFSYYGKQSVIGILFGLFAAVSLQFSVELGGAIINVCNAIILTAGLLFGGPAGMIAGVIGGIARWCSTYWGIGMYTYLAGIMSLILSGIIAMAVRKYLLDNKKASWMYGVVVGITVEVFHMLLVFLTNMSDLKQAFTMIQRVAIPSILLNGLTILLSCLTVSLLFKKKHDKTQEVKKIAQTFQVWMLMFVFIAFWVTLVFSFIVQNRIAKANTEELLRVAMSDVYNAVKDASDEKLLDHAEYIIENLPDTINSDELDKLAKTYDVAEINIVNAVGIIVASTNRETIGYDMASGTQSAEFLKLLYSEKRLVQEYQPTSFDSMVYRKYAAVVLSDGGFLQVGIDAGRFQKDIASQIMMVAKNRRIGQQGCIIMCDSNWVIMSDRDGNEGERIEKIGIKIDDHTPKNKKFKTDAYGVPSYCMYTKSEGYNIITVLPVEESLFSRKVAIHLIMFMEILVFASLFACIYFLVKKLVVENIHKVNNSLAQITGGNLDVVVDVRTNEEFISLSDDINETVTTLKRYIKEAAERIDAELEFAKTIQYSVLPAGIPSYQHQDAFEIYASMATAKEVGGDFYDFYMVGEDKLAFMIADVSGKGIPAAMFMMTAKTLMKSLAEHGMDVAEIFAGANDKLCEGNDANMFVTAWMGILDLKTGYLSYANAGHNPPMIKRENGVFEYLESKPNFILAGMEGIPYQMQEFWLQPGDCIYIYTDGVTEAQTADGELFGDDRLLKSLNDGISFDMESLCKKVKTDVDNFVGENEQFDDMTMLAMKLNYLV